MWKLCFNPLPILFRHFFLSLYVSTTGWEYLYMRIEKEEYNHLTIKHHQKRHENLCWLDPHFCPCHTPWIDPNFWGVLPSNSQIFEEHTGGRTRKATRNEIWKIRRCCSLEAVLLEMENNLHWSLTQDLSSPTAYPLKPRPFSFLWTDQLYTSL